MTLILLFGFVVSGCEIQNLPKDKYYDVTFMMDGEVITKTQVKKGESAIAPPDPEKEGYEFIGWDTLFDNIIGHIEVKAMFKPIDISYTVTFLDALDQMLVKIDVIDGGSASINIVPVKEGYEFIGWDKELNNIKSDLIVRPLFKQVSEVRIQYTSYLDSITYHNILSKDDLLNRLNFQTDLHLTINNIFSGGFRGADQMHYYDASNIINRNVYGFEIAVDALGIVVQKATIVSLPQGGFILSGHSSTATLLQNQILIGDILRYNPTTKSINCYRNTQISNTIGLEIEINLMINKINQAYLNLLALNYQQISNKINETIELYNNLVSSYNSDKYNLAKELLLELDFLLIELGPVEVRAFWHYPLRAGSYTETNLLEVKQFLKQVSTMGFNRIYLNTNFGGYSIYKSNYLQQKLTNFNIYAGYKDYLECFISEAHELGIEVFAWTNTLIAGDGYLSDWYRSRNWINLGFNGEDNFNGMYFIDISNPDVQTFLYNVYHELANNYELDGIEYDFIRYPSGNLSTFKDVITNPSTIKDSGYTPTFIEAFRSQYPFTGDLKELIKSSPQVRTNWLSFKTMLLNDTVNMLSTTIRSARPNIQISAAVMPSISSARSAYLQDWRYWLDMGWVDILDPMIYTASNENLLQTLTSMLATVKGDASLVAGIFPEGSGGEGKMNAEQIALVFNTNIDGFSKFSGRTIFANPSLIKGFKTIYRTYTALPNSNNRTIFNAYIYDTLDKVEHFYQYADQQTNYQDLINLLETYHNIQEETDYLILLESLKTEIIKITNDVVKERLLNNLEQIINKLR